jgi:pimeloyl-ACP methyl ester carboxylesterase
MSMNDNAAMKVEEDRYINIGGIQTRYWQAGTRGSTVILLHGISCSVLEWKPNIAALAARHRVFAVDLMGYGLTDIPPEETYTIRRLARFTLDFLSTHGITRAHFAGNSMGGRIALECALTAPERVASMVLAAPAGIGRDTIFNLRLATIPVIGEMLTRPSRFGLKMLWKEVFYNSSFVTDELIDAKMELATRPGSQKVFLRNLRSFVSLRGFPGAQVDSLHAGLPTVDVPSLVIWGKQDRFLPVAHADILQRLLPDVRVQVFDKCGHMPQIECAEGFNKSVLDFWDELDQQY